MNTVRMGVITLCAAVGVERLSIAARHGDSTRRSRRKQLARSRTHFAASNQAVSRQCGALHRMRSTLNTVREPRSSPDTSDLTQTIADDLNQSLDALNADIGPEGEYVDPRSARRSRCAPTLSWAGC